MDTLIIFGAKYLYILSAVVGLHGFFKIPNEQRKRALVFIIASFVLAFIIAVILRHAYYNPRPFVVGGYKPLIAHEADNGLPSDHMLLVSAIASVFIFYHKKYSVYLWFLAILVGVSRVLAGVHHTLDIAASAAIALLAAGLVYAAAKRLKML